MAVPAYPPDPIRTRIYSHITRSRFLHLEDSLTLASPKVRVFAGEFSKGQGMKSSAFHFLDVDDLRVLLADLAWGKAVDFIDFKGGIARGNSKIVSRVLTVNTKDAKVWFELKNGPGQKLDGGAVKPVGEAEADVSIALEVREARKLAFAALAYLQAWDVVRRLGTGDR
jgi:hypothetical protein